MGDNTINNQLANDLANLNDPFDASAAVDNFRSEVVQIDMVREKLVQTTNRDVLNKLYGKISDALGTVEPVTKHKASASVIHRLLEALYELKKIVHELVMFESKLNQPQNIMPAQETKTNNGLVDMNKHKRLELVNQDKAA